MLILFGNKGGIGRYIEQMENPLPIDWNLADLVQKQRSPVRKSSKIVSCNRIQCDIESPGQVDEFFRNTLGKYDAREPLYVINATGKNISGYLHKQDPEEFMQVIKSNLLGSFNILHCFAQHVKGRRDASALFLSSICTKTQTLPGVSAYVAAKAGLEGLVHAAAPELARNKARVNAVRMGYFDAGMKHKIPAEGQKIIKKAIPLGEWGEPGHLLHLIKTVLINTYMTGSIIDITGGL
jgi:3-oxoacyl-[acyl-carrier protein] reductase